MGSHEPIEYLIIERAEQKISFAHHDAAVDGRSTPAPYSPPAHNERSDALVREGVLPQVDLVNLTDDHDHRTIDRSRFSPALESLKHEGEFKELHLHNRAANHDGADGLIYVRKDFDPSKPVHLAIYNHGFGSTVSSALQRRQIKEMMANAESNTILVLPEWQSHPGTRNGDSGTFAQPGKFERMVAEIMEKTEALHGASLSNVDRIDIISHSAGYAPGEAEIYKNHDLARKIQSITLLDSLYDKHGFDRWLSDNIEDLSAGRKRFFNFSNSSTMAYSREQAGLVASMLHERNLPANNYVADYEDGKGQVDRHAREMASRSIVFASTTTKHLDIPGQYVGATLAALNFERQ